MCLLTCLLLLIVKRVCLLLQPYWRKLIIKNGVIRLFHCILKRLKRLSNPTLHPTDGPLLMGEIINLVAEKTAGNAVLVNDVGENQMFSCRYFKYNNSHSVVTSGA